MQPICICKQGRAHVSSHPPIYQQINFAMTNVQDVATSSWEVPGIKPEKW